MMNACNQAAHPLGDNHGLTINSRPTVMESRFTPFRRELFLLREDPRISVRELRYLGSAPLPELEGETGSGSAGTTGRAIAALRSRPAIPTRRTST